jgi:hypothetical protein
VQGILNLGEEYAAFRIDAAYIFTGGEFLSTSSIEDKPVQHPQGGTSVTVPKRRA